MENCFRETSAVGFKYATDSKYLCHQIFWVFVLILSFCGVFFHCYSLTVTYLAYPKMVALSHEYIQKEFPSVTVYNNQPISDVNFRRYVNISDKSNEKLISLYNDGDDTKLFSIIGRELSKHIGHSFKDMVLYLYISDSSCSEEAHNWKLYQSTRSFNCYTFTANQSGMNVEKDEKDENEFSLILYKEVYKDNHERPSNPFRHNIDSNNLMISLYT